MFPIACTGLLGFSADKQGVTWELVGFAERYGFTHVPGGDQFRNRSILAFHNSVLPPLTSDAKLYDLKMAEVRRLGGGGWVTETGDTQCDLADQHG